MPKYAEMPIDPVYKDIWVKAASESVHITLPNLQKFNTLRAKLYQTRKILQARGDGLYEAIKLLSITKENHAKGVTHLVIDPADSGLKDILATQGYGEAAPPDFENDYDQVS